MSGRAEKNYRSIVVESIRQAEGYRVKGKFDDALSRLENAKFTLAGVTDPRSYERLYNVTASAVKKLVDSTAPSEDRPQQESKLAKIHDHAVGLGINLSNDRMSRRAKDRVPKNFHRYFASIILLLTGLSLFSFNLTGSVIGANQRYFSWSGGLLFIAGVLLALLVSKKN